MHQVDSLYNRNTTLPIELMMGAPISQATGFGARLRKLRTERNLSIARLAQISGITQGYVSQIESGKRETPGLNVVTALAQALRVTLDELVGFDLSASPRTSDETEARFQRLETGILELGSLVRDSVKATTEAVQELRQQSAPKTRKTGQAGVRKK